MRSLRLKARRGIGIVAVRKAELVARPRPRVFDHRGKVPVVLRFQQHVTAIDDDRYALLSRRPDAEVHATVDDLRTDTHERDACKKRSGVRQRQLPLSMPQRELRRGAEAGASA